MAKPNHDAGQRADGLTTEERDEVRRLRREVRQVREERAIAAAGPDRLWVASGGHHVHPDWALSTHGAGACSAG
jgi:hypothetical protein